MGGERVNLMRKAERRVDRRVLHCDMWRYGEKCPHLSLSFQLELLFISVRETSLLHILL